MAIEGTLDLFQLPEILQLISQQGKTGILTVQGESDIIAISFEGGKVVAADALNQTLEESLGEVLAGQGLVSPSDFAAVAAQHQAGNGRFLDLLVEQEFLDREQLLEALRLHTYRLLVELLSWRSGEFKFYTGDEVSYEDGFKAISVEELLIRSVEEAAGEGHPTIPDSRSIYEAVPPPLPIRVRKEGEGPGSEQGVTWMTEGEAELLRHLAGGGTVAALVKQTGANEYRVRFALHRLLEAGVVRRRAATLAEPPARPPGAAPAVPGAIPRPLAEVEMPIPPATTWTAAAAPPRAGEGRRVGVWASLWVGRFLALLALALLLLTLVASPSTVPLPFPWQQSQRQDLIKGLRGSLYQRIDRAAKTYYLVEGHFPEDLQQLVDLGLLAPADLRGPDGLPLTYRPGDSSYVLQSTLDGKVLAGTVSTEAVTGDFLLDPEFLHLSQDAEEPPLVLLE
jgi:Domain of unknown function (DUF4388)